MISLKRVNSDSLEFRELVCLLNQDLNGRYGVKQSEYDTYNIIEYIDTIVIANYESNPAGCGCFKKYDDETIEIKRMFVKPEFRGKGISKLILRELETWGKHLGYTKAILETGKNQPEAISLYNKSGYNRIPNYDQYIGIDNSICMMKSLVEI
jgi:GNAT superfamily N-acetyltransferase